MDRAVNKVAKEDVWLSARRIDVARTVEELNFTCRPQ